MRQFFFVTAHAGGQWHATGWPPGSITPIFDHSYLTAGPQGAREMPGRIDENRPFLPVNIAILTVSDTRDASQDRSGDTLADLVTSAGHRVATRKIVRDEQEMI